MVLDKLRTKIDGKREAAGEASRDKMDSAKESASNLRTKVEEKLDESVEKLLIRLDEARPILDEAGYTIFDIRMTPHVPPKLGIVLMPKEPGVCHAAEVIERGTLTKPQRALLEGLVQIQRMHGTFTRNAYAVRGIEIDIGLPPSVCAHLVKIGGAEQSGPE